MKRIIGLFMFLAAIASIAAALGQFFGNDVVGQYVVPGIGVIILTPCALIIHMGIHRSPILSCSSKEELILSDRTGAHAVWKSTRKIVVIGWNKKDLKQVLDTTGEVEDTVVRLDGKEIPLVLKEGRGLETNATVDFDAELIPWHQHDYVREVTFKNAFLKDIETFFIKFDHPAIHLTLQVEFPQDRPPKDVRLVLEEGGAERNQGPMRQKNDASTGNVLAYRDVWFVRSGQLYRVIWNW